MGECTEILMPIDLGLQLVGSLKKYVSFAKQPYTRELHSAKEVSTGSFDQQAPSKHRSLLQKSPTKETYFLQKRYRLGASIQQSIRIRISEYSPMPLPLLQNIGLFYRALLQKRPTDVILIHPHSSHDCISPDILLCILLKEPYSLSKQPYTL